MSFGITLSSKDFDGFENRAMPASEANGLAGHRGIGIPQFEQRPETALFSFAARVEWVLAAVRGIPLKT